MRIRRTLFPLVGLSVMLAACATEANDDRTEAERAGSIAAPAPDPAVVRRLIDSSNTALAAALQAEDVAAHNAIYAPDGIVMMSNTPASKGSDAIREHATGMFAGVNFTDVKFTTESLEVSGDLAVETGSYAMTITPQGGKAMQDKGKYITVWKRQADGSWKIHRDISNSDLEAR